MKNYYGSLDENKNVISRKDPVGLSQENTRVAEDTVGALYISTVFLRVNHGYNGKDLWFETMVFPKGSFSELFCDRYETYKEALDGHALVVDRIKRGLAPNGEALPEGGK